MDPRLTSGISLFEQYPYLLATGITGAVCLLGTLLVAMFCHETLAEGDKLAKTKIQSMTTWQLLKAPGVASGLYIFGHTMFLALANTAVLPVFLFTSTANGGLGFSPRWISYFLAGLAASQGLWTLMSFPTLKRKMGTRKVMQICSCGWPLLFASMPVLNEVLRRDAIAAFWAVVPVPLIIGGGVAMSFGECLSFRLQDHGMTDFCEQPALNCWSTTHAHLQRNLLSSMHSHRSVQHPRLVTFLQGN